jgi:hypothetical protein
MPEGLYSMVVVRPPEGSYSLPPGLCEESFDVDTRLGRVNLLSVLFNVVSAVNRNIEEISDLVLILSGPVTFFYRPGGGILWEEIHEILIHPLNLKNVGFRFSWGSLQLTLPLVDALVKELEVSGFATGTGPSSVTVSELGGTRITIYNPVEVGFSGSLWDALDPGTSIYIGPPGKLKWLRDMTAFLPDKRTALAGQFINDAKVYAASGNFHSACVPLAGAAQVLGKIRLRGGIVKACSKKGFGARAFGRFLREVETARATIDALWRYQAGEREMMSRAVPVEPVSVTIPGSEAGEFFAMCRDLGIVCIAIKSGEEVTMYLDKYDLELRAGELGTGKVPQFMVFFEEVTGPAHKEAERERLIRIRDAGGTVRYYDLRRE